MGALVLVLLGLLAPHENSNSFSSVTVSGARIELQLRCQARSVIEALDLDRDLDGRLSSAELEAGRKLLADYVVGRYELWADAPEGGGGGGTPLAAQLESLDELVRGEGLFAEQWVHLTFGLEAERAPASLRLRVSLFEQQNPFHRDACTLVWNDEAPSAWLFGIDGPVWDFEPAARRRPGVLRSHVVLGLEHLLGGWDHIAFVLALLVAARSVRGLIGTVTAFTLAHSVTLALAALDVVAVPPRLVELAIAMSVAYVGAEALLLRRPGGRAFEAFCFGLIHGLGFASFLGASLFSEPLKITALVGFNLGVELGQLAIVLVAVLVLRWLPGDRSGPAPAGAGTAATDPAAWLAPRWLRLGLAACVTVLGSVWFCQRAGWL